MDTDINISSVGGPPRALLRALSRLLRPLVRLLLANQVTYPFFSSLLKTVFVQVADQEFPVPGKQQTDSRISLLTGVHRKDVKRLRGQKGEDEAITPNASLGAQLVGRWIGLPRYLDEAGNPLALPRLASEGGQESFEGLVESVSKDIRPRAVLDEWLRLGVVRVDAEDRVRLNASAFVPESGFDEKAHFFGRNVRDHIAACAHNLGPHKAPMLERSVFYDGLTAESVERLEALSRDLGMQMLQAVNRAALELQKQDCGKAGAGHRMNFGVYYFHDAA